MGSEGIDQFLFCEKCGKKILKKLSDGKFEFKFGRRIGCPVVNIVLEGTVFINCLREKCGHTNIFEP
jgi:hypothetical protein